MKKRFLLVTANENETKAILKESSFSYQSDVRSDNKDDDSFYNVGQFGCYEAVHFQLSSQASINSEASLPSIMDAIDYWNPDAVILIGIAFGKDNEEQHIGDVLVSEKIADYESGKMKDGKLISNGSIPESGKTLVSVFKHFSTRWEHTIDDRKANCETGLLLSGDKVVDDKDFKAQLFKEFPKAIGGEMEGRGAYAACRRKRLSEWIVIKAICDWGENKGNPNKQHDQEIASESAVSFLSYVFSIPSAFDKLPSSEKKVSFDAYEKKNNEQKSEEKPLGYFISVGTTTCRLFKVKDNITMQQTMSISYKITDPEADGYFEGITRTVKERILPIISKTPSRLFPKVFLDYNFSSVFEKLGDLSIKDDFITDFYNQTNLCLNLLTKAQTMDNLKRHFGSIPPKSAIVIINSDNTDVLEFNGNEFIMHSLSVTVKDVKQRVKELQYPEIWTSDMIDDLKEFITGKIKSQLSGVNVKQSFIIKDELKFMKDEHYPLILRNGYTSLSQKSYKATNRSRLFYIDYRAELQKRLSDPSLTNRFHAFKYGHLLIETILDFIGNQTVIPQDEHSIHGSGIGTYISYIFNVAISGSTHNGRSQYMSEARDHIVKMGANVLSPIIDPDGTLVEITPETQYQHLKAIKECDMLFVCNKDEDGYIGESTKCEIYYAYALNKTIAFWREPPAEGPISIVPNERWGDVMSYEI